MQKNGALELEHTKLSEEYGNNMPFTENLGEHIFSEVGGARGLSFEKSIFFFIR